jgi:succinate-semialdehyde dehydrogenase / glutarate-semialdehyde dehydrogenase
MYEARNEVQYAADYFEWFSEEASRIYGDTIQASVSGHRIYTRKEPIGVVGLITPWNWPAGMPTRKVGPALAAGCTVVMKSPGETPLTMNALMVLAESAGLPKGVVNIVTSLKNTAEIGTTICESPVIKKVSFTGSTRVGKILMGQAASTLKKCSFELGGNAPFIVFDDADLDLAVKGAVACKFRSSGQTCICANRLYVQKGIYDHFTKAFTAEVNKFKVGDGMEKDVTHGPLIHDRAIEKAQQHIDDAVKKGGKVVVGGKKMPELGDNFFQPTVIRDVPHDALIAHDETFGPVAAIFSFDTEAEIVKLANDTDVGLASYLYSNDAGRCYRVAEAIEAGMVGINTGLVSDVAMPFGGVKESGFGREGSKYGIDEYMVIKAVTYGEMDKPLQGS